MDARGYAAPSQKYFAVSLKHAKEGNIIDMHNELQLSNEILIDAYNGQIEKKLQYSYKSTEFNKGDYIERGGGARHVFETPHGRTQETRLQRGNESLAVSWNKKGYLDDQSSFYLYVNKTSQPRRIHSPEQR